MIRQDEKIVRTAVHAGTWYPVDRKEIESYVQPKLERKKAIAIVCPHAGWLYSGKVAGEVFSRVQPASLYVAVGPNHHGLGAPVSVYPAGSWRTPLGDLQVDHSVADAIVEHSSSAEADTLAHQEEHSLEVLMPFVKFFNPDARIVPISMYDYRPSTCRDLGAAIAAAVTSKQAGRQALLVASTDMSHYVTAEEADELDHIALDRILALDPDGLLQAVVNKDMSMCGSGPVAAVLQAALKLGASKTELVRYTNSGAVTGDNEQVVAYAGVIIS